MKKVSIEFTEGQLSDLYLALDLAVAVMSVEGQGELEQSVLNQFKLLCHEEIEKLQKDF